MVQDLVQPRLSTPQASCRMTSSDGSWDVVDECDDSEPGVARPNTKNQRVGRTAEEEDRVRSRSKDSVSPAMTFLLKHRQQEVAAHKQPKAYLAELDPASFEQDLCHPALVAFVMNAIQVFICQDAVENQPRSKDTSERISGVAFPDELKGHCLKTRHSLPNWF